MPIELKLLASGCACTPKPLDQEAPDCCDLLPEDILWPPEASLVVTLASQLQALWQRARPCTCRSCIPSAHLVTVYGMCQIREGQAAGFNRQLFFPAQASQTTNPLSECLSQPEGMCRTRRKVLSLITKRGKSLDWLLIELPG